MSLQAKVTSLALILTLQLVFAQSLPYENSRFGIFGAYTANGYGHFKSRMNFTNTQYWNWVDGRFQDLGAHWTRSNLELVWDFIEPSLDSAYNWNPQPFLTDSVIVNVYKAGNQVHWLGVFHEGGVFGQRPDKPPLRDPLSDTLRYQRFVQNAVERYDGDGFNDVNSYVKVKYWQVGNEVPLATAEHRDNYVRWVKIISSAIRKADAAARIVLIAPTQGFSLDPWLRDVILALGNSNYFDVIDIHHWGKANNYQMPGVRQTRQLLDSLGLRHVQIWSCENGTWAYQPTNQPYQTPEEQARSLIKRYVYNIDLGLDKLFWNNLMEWLDFGGNQGSIFNSMGLVGDGMRNSEPPQNFNRPRVSYFAYKLLAQAIDIDKARYAGKSAISGQGPNLYAYYYRSLSTDSAACYILWRDSGSQSVSFHINTPQVLVTNMISDSLGNIRQEYTVNADGQGNITITVGTDPLLVKETFGIAFQTEWKEVWVRNLGTESNNGNRLYTRIHQPVDSLYAGQKFPAVIFVPGGLGAGAMGNDSLAEQGFVVIHFNVEGRVSPHLLDKRSEGVEDYNGKIHQDDLKAIIDYVLSLPNVQAENVGIYTSSYGITMGAGCVGRYPNLPVKYLVDNEGPSDSKVTCFDYWNDSTRTARAFQIFGHYSTAKDSSPVNIAWWGEREAVRWIGKFKGRYVRIQTEADHAQPLWFHGHTIDMINAATNTAFGGKGQCVWTRVNGSENIVNKAYDQNNQPLWLSEQIDERRKATDYIIEMANMSPMTTVERNERGTGPEGFHLFQNYPNPFNPSTTIRFSLPQREFVTLKIFDVLGREVASMVDGELSTGEHSVVLDAKNLASGVYFYRLTTPTFSQIKLMEVVK